MLEGDLRVLMDGKLYFLNPGGSLLIPLLAVHSARSMTEQPARVLVSCQPGWTDGPLIASLLSPSSLCIKRLC